MKDSNFADKLIGYEDMNIVRSLAAKYNISVADFGRMVVRQSERNLSRQIRVTDDEYNDISEKANAHGVTITRWCSLACSQFLKEKDKDIFFSDFVVDKAGRERRIAVTIRNQKEETELISVATNYSIKISTLIRYCSLRYDGKTIRRK